MKDIQIFNNDQFGEIRTVVKDNEPWFVAADVCQALDLDKTQTRRLDDDEKGMYSIQTPGGIQEFSIVNEPGLYSLVLGSRKPEAKAFKRWITHEVIPSIRKTGGYTVKKDMTDYQRMMAETRAENARIRKAQILERIAKDYDGTFKQVLHANAVKELTGEFLLPLPQLAAKTFTAGELGALLGVSANKIGQTANRHGLKTERYGAWFNDKSRSSNKEVQSFRYFDTAIPALRKLLDEQN